MSAVRFLFAILAGLALFAAPVHAAGNGRTVVVVMFDGFAPAMVEAANTPNLDRIDVHPTVMALLGLEPGNPVDGTVVAEALAD